MNGTILDIGVVGVILFCAVRAYRQGFIQAGLKFLPTLTALCASYFVAPLCSKMFRQTPIFTAMQSAIANALHLNTAVGEAAMGTQTQIIQQMQLPEFLKSALLENNNPVVYEILHVERLQDYIAGFLANMSVNILSVILVGIIAFIAVKLFLKALNLVFKLPVLSFVNRLCGLMIGTLQGISFIWIICILLTFFYYNPKFVDFFRILDTSKVASVFYENNMLLLLILKIFA